MKLIRNILDKNLQNVDEKDLLETGKDQRSHCLFSFFLPFVLLTFLLIYIPIFPPIWTDPSEAQIEDYLSTQYTNEYYPTAEAEIQKILLTAANISDPIEKLTTIAAWEIEDFVDIVEYDKWNESYNGTRYLSNKYCYDENGKIKVPFCCFKGYNYANVIDDSGEKISSEKYKATGIEEEPVAFNISYDFLTNPDFERGYNFSFGEKKPLIEWFIGGNNIEEK